MAKAKTQFVCQQCGAISGKWSGRCDNCGEWNTLVEQISTNSGTSSVAKAASSGKPLQVQSIKDVQSDDTSNRMKTGVADLNDVLGGGVLPGSVVLLAG